MQKRGILLIFVLIVIVPFVNADIAPSNSHPLEKCVKIVNLNEFPDFYLIGYVTGPSVNGHETYIIEENMCITMGYKFNNLKIIAAEKSYIDLVGLEKIKVEKTEIPGDCGGKCYMEEINDENIFLSDIEINPYGGYVGKNDPLIKLDVEYSIANFSGDKLIMQKYREIYHYNKGTQI